MLKLQDRYQLSRFAFLRGDSDGLVLETSLHYKRFPVRSASVIRILAALSRPVQLESLLAAANESERAVLRSFLTTCEDAKLLTRVGDDGVTEEETGSLGYWEFHDLLFHSSSRFGRNRNPIGGTYRLRDRLPPEEVLSDEDPGSLSLPKPDSSQADAPFSRVLEGRRSGYSEKPLVLDKLAAFLYWTCRTTKEIGPDGERVVQKLYPSGGSLHPLRVYVAVKECDGCPPGLYRYMDRKHSLSLVRSLDGIVQKFFADAGASAGGILENPRLLFILAARFHRTAWKYESIAYRLILMEVGALLQTMYLTATALGLKGCALGCGDSDHFARAIESDYYTETSVGEFLLGA